MDDQKNRELSAHLRPIRTYATGPSGYDGQGVAPMENLGEEEHPIREYVRVCITNRWLILSVSAVVLALSLLYSFLATPMYAADATLKIGTYNPLLAGANAEDMLRQQTREKDYLETQVKILASLSLSDKVLAEENIAKDVKDYFSRKTGLFGVFTPFGDMLGSDSPKSEQEPSEDAYRFPVGFLQAYLSLITVSPIRNTSIVKVTATTAYPELSAKIANAHSRAFIDLVREERHRSTLENLVFLKAQAEELADKVALSERNIASYAEENAIVSLNKDENIVVRRMSELSQLLTQSTAKRIKSETAFKEAKSGSGVDSTSLDDESINDMRSHLKEVEAEYAMLSEKFKPSYPKMVQLRARIDTLKKNLREQRQEAVRALKAQFRGDLEAERELKKQLEIQKSQAFELSRREVQYNIMKREFESLKDLHQSVLRQLKEAQISAESQGSNISIGDRAAAPLKHTTPNRLLNTVLALFVGPLLGIGLALLIETLDNTVKTPEEVERYLQLPSLGVVPAFGLEYITEPGKADDKDRLLLEQGDSEESGESSESGGFSPAVKDDSSTLPAQPDEFVTLHAPRSIASEAFRAIRTGILLSSADNPPRVILVTSAKKSEGKTTLISNLAISLAQSSERTIVIDADLRRPSIHSLFPLDPNAPGLSNYLTAQNELDEVINDCAIPNLFVIPSGPKPPNPAELVGSRKMAELLEQLSEQYDYVLVDTPPVLPVTDAVMLSRVVDGVVLVVRGQDTQKGVAKDAAARLRQVGARILGVVLNEVNVRSGQYYYYYRDTYSDYYGEDSETKGRRKRKIAGQRSR